MMETTALDRKKRLNTTSGQFRIALRQFRRNKIAVVGIIIFLIIVLSCVFADKISAYDYAAQDIRNKFAPLSMEHPFGTDQFGRDVFTRMLYGGRISLVVAFSAVLLSAAVAVLLGTTAAFFGKAYEMIVMRIIDILQSIPGLLLAAAVSTAIGTGIQNSIIAIAIGQLANTTRLMYSATLTVKNQEYLEAARACGASKTRIIFHHVIKNILAPLIVQVTSRLGSGITQIASLSFLGLGVMPPTPEWGSILNAGKQYMRSYWPLVTFPGLVIALTLISVSFIGDGIRDAVDPRLKR